MHISQHLAVLRRPNLVRSLLRMLKMDEPLVVRTKEQIAAAKRRKRKQESQQCKRAE